MNLSRRTLLASTTLSLAVRSACAAPPIKVQVGWAAGGPVDTIFRMVTDAWATELGQAVVLDNKPGVAGDIAAQFVLNAPADGQTVFGGGIGVLGGLNATLYKSARYDAQRDFRLIGLATANPSVLCVGRSVPVVNLAEFLKWVKNHPKAVSYASGGTGSSSHLSMALLEQEANVSMIHVPYKSSPQGTTDLIGGIVDSRLLGVAEALAFKNESAVKQIAVTSLERHPSFPDLPTVSESLPGFEASFPSGMSVSSKTPQEVVQRLRDTLAAALRRKDLRENLARAGSSQWNSQLSPDEYVKQEAAKWKRVIARAGISAV